MRRWALRLADHYRYRIEAVLKAQSPKEVPNIDFLLSCHCAAELYDSLCDDFDITPLSEERVIGLGEARDSPLRPGEEEPHWVKVATTRPLRASSSSSPPAPPTSAVRRRAHCCYQLLADHDPVLCS
jgi:hypothetical protein